MKTLKIIIKNYRAHKLKNPDFLTRDMSYLTVYPFFVQYFFSLQKIEIDNLIIGAHSVYSWMPTILRNLRLDHSEKVLEILNQVKINKEISEKDLLELRSCVNNSLVGVSKLLHFINPEKYPIWDTHICTYLYHNSARSFVNNPRQYLEYTQYINSLIRELEFNDFYTEIITDLKRGGYGTVSRIRALELAIFSMR